ncbi:MAG: GGDEF domain-containing protein [Xanthobacteraceae bacterium]
MPRSATPIVAPLPDVAADLRQPVAQAASSAASRKAGSALPSRAEHARLSREIVRLKEELEATRAKVREIETHAILDPLTELLNRRGFQREIERADSYIKRYGGRAVLAYLDLDGFKAVNDRHGHAAGDALLHAIAVMLKRNLRASDAIARFGGDEFALLMWNLSDTDALAKLAALEQAIADTVIEWQGAPVSVHASAGMAPLEGEPSFALAKADAAMYRRKRARQGGGKLTR